MKKFVSGFLITCLGILITLVFILPVQAANRNDALWDLKDTFNSPVGQKVSAVTLILIVITCIALVMIFRYYFSREEKEQQVARELYREKHKSHSSEQKRGWFRLKIDAEFKWIAAHLADKARLNQFNTDQLIDISGGGLSFSTLEVLNTNDEINMILPTSLDNPLIVNGRVIRAVKGDTAYNVSVQFIGMRDGQRDKLVAWIQSNQRTAVFFEKQKDLEEEFPEDTEIAQHNEAATEDEDAWKQFLQNN